MGSTRTATVLDQLDIPLEQSCGKCFWDFQVRYTTLGPRDENCDGVIE